jgi:hypothetical protein
VRTWVTTVEERNAALGQTLECRLCDQEKRE